MRHLWYEQRVRCHLVPRIGEVLLGKLTPILISDMLVKMGRDGSSGGEQRRVFRTLQFALGRAVKLEQIGVNPCKKVEPPKAGEKEITCLTRDRALALLAAARGGPVEPFITLALDTGRRPGELFGIRWPDLDLRTGEVDVRQSLEYIRGKMRLEVPKTKGSRRKIQLAPRTVEVMRRHKEAKGGDGDGLVFTSPGGGFVNHSNFSHREFRPLVKDAKIPAVPKVGLYTLRHTSATLLLSAGVSIKTVSGRLGHGSITITVKHYVHSLPAMRERAVQATQDIYNPTTVPREAGNT